MEIINTTIASPEQCIKFLLEKNGLFDLIGASSCACFLITRTIETEDLFRQIIDNIDSIDATTRQYVAFIVFYGETTVYARKSSSYQTKMVETHLKGISFPRTMIDRRLPNIHRYYFDEKYGVKFRDSPESVNLKRFSYHMTSSINVLMQHFEIKESDIPSLLFVDPKLISNHVLVKLPKENTFQHIYHHILVPLSESFRSEKLMKWSGLKSKVLKLERQFQQYIEHLPFKSELDRLDNNIKVARDKWYEFRAKWFVDTYSIAQDNNELRNLKDELKRIELRLDLLNKEIQNGGETKKIKLELAKLIKKRNKEVVKLFQRHLSPEDDYFKNIENNFYLSYESSKSRKKDFIAAQESKTPLDVINNTPKNIFDLLKDARYELARFESGDSGIGQGSQPDAIIVVEYTLRSTEYSKSSKDLIMLPSQNEEQQPISTVINIQGSVAAINSGTGSIKDINQSNFSPEQHKSIAEVAKEIQELLIQLSSDSPSPLATATHAEVKIQEKVDFRNKIIAALKAGGKTAIEELVKHPAATILLAIAESWSDVE